MAPCRGMYWLSLAILIIGFLSVGIRAQGSTATCLSQFGWMANSKGQNPCVISAYLLGACEDGLYFIDPLETDSYYTGPNGGEQDQCACNTVAYNTMSACGYCQNETYVNWSIWDANCSTIYQGVFPRDIPAGTAVPHWAFQDVKESDRFNVTLAQLVGDSPESTASVVPSIAHVSSTSILAPVTSLAVTASSSTLPSVTSFPVTASPSIQASATSTPSLSDSPPSGGKNTGQMALGIVAGLVGVALAIGAVFFILRNRPQNSTPAPLDSDSTSPINPSTADVILSGTRMPQPRLYDPSDPSTFPATLPRLEATTVAGPSGVTHRTSPLANPPVNYSGMPEV